MNYQDKLIREIGKKYGIDPRVVQSVVYSPFKFINRVVRDPSDERPIRIMYFGAFDQKMNKNKSRRMEKRADKLLDNIDDVTVVMGTMLEFPIQSAKSARKIIEDAVASKDIEKIEMIWEAWQEFKKQ